MERLSIEGAHRTAGAHPRLGGCYNIGVLGPRLAENARTYRSSAKTTGSWIVGIDNDGGGGNVEPLSGGFGSKSARGRPRLRPFFLVSAFFLSELAERPRRGGVTGGDRGVGCGRLVVWLAGSVGRWSCFGVVFGELVAHLGQEEPGGGWVVRGLIGHHCPLGNGDGVSRC
jgi:hypothetical protein